MIISPCISICKTDPITGYCYGCGRSEDDKKNWINEKKDEKLEAEHLKKHLKSITDHIKTLSLKKYSQLLKMKVSLIINMIIIINFRCFSVFNYRKK